MEFVTQPCVSCHKTSILDVALRDVYRWRSGEHVQDVWPDKSADWRELLITGTHKECWDQMFKEAEPEAEYR